MLQEPHNLTLLSPLCFSTVVDKNWKNGELKPVLSQAYGAGREYEWYVNWRLFFMACAELWGLDNGEEWIVSHYLFERR